MPRVWRIITRWSAVLVLCFGLLTVSVIAKSDADIQVHITATGHKYHRAGCRYLRQSDYIVTLEEAKARGLGPYKVCQPPQ